MIRLAVIGAGMMGANHARVAMGLRDAELCYVVDSDLDRARAIAEITGVEATDDPRSIVSEIDAAVVAVPTDHHVEVASALLKSGIDVLIEKPLAPSVEEAAGLDQLATRLGRVLAVGHIERFNPATLELVELVNKPVHVEMRRISPYINRIPDGVTSDMMIHDLDLVSALVRSPVTSVQAMTRAVRSTTEDLSTAMLAFENGATATLTASRLGQEKVRTIEVTEHDSVIRANLIRQEVSIHTVREASFGGRTDRGYREMGTVEVPYLKHRGEPLFLELHFFIEAVLGRPAPIVTATEATQAIKLSEWVLNAAKVPAA